MEKVRIRKFDAGIQTDKRSRVSGGCVMSSHFDHTVSPNKLVPRRSFKEDNKLEGTAEAIKARDLKSFYFVLAVSPGFYKNMLIAIGKKSSGTGCAAYKKDAWTDDGWLELDDNLGAHLTSSNYNPVYGFMAHRGTNGSDYFFFPTSNGVGHINGASTPYTINDNVQATSSLLYAISTHSSDDETYINIRTNSATLQRLNNAGTVTTSVYDAGEGFISGHCRFGNYTAVSIFDYYEKRSYVQLWDMVNSEPISVIDWGPGRLHALESLDGYLVGVLDESIFDSEIANDSPAMVVKVSTGGRPVEIFRIDAAAGYTGDEIRQPQVWKRKDEMLFYMRVPTNSTATTFHEGLWSVRRRPDGTFAVTLGYDTTNLGKVNMWYGIGQNAVFNHNHDNGISIVDTDEIYDLTSIFETLVNPEMQERDYYKPKALKAVRLMTEPLQEGQSATIKTKRPTDSDWTTIATVSDTNSITREATNFESTGEPLFDFDEVEFRIESDGGAVITGFDYFYEFIDDLIDE